MLNYIPLISWSRLLFDKELFADVDKSPLLEWLEGREEL